MQNKKHKMPKWVVQKIHEYEASSLFHMDGNWLIRNWNVDFDSKLEKYNSSPVNTSGYLKFTEKDVSMNLEKSLMAFWKPKNEKAAAFILNGNKFNKDQLEELINELILIKNEIAAKQNVIAFSLYKTTDKALAENPQLPMWKLKVDSFRYNQTESGQRAIDRAKNTLDSEDI